MNKILITGVGGSAAIGFIRSIRKGGDYRVIGCDANKYYLERAEADVKYLIPEAADEMYGEVLMDIASEEKPDFIYSQVDAEIRELSKMRRRLDEAGIKYFWPDHEVIETCSSKYKSYLCWERAGLTVPKTRFIDNEEDLKRAFGELGSPLWIREDSGAFGKGSLPATGIEEATVWIGARNGWGRFTAAQMLDPASMATWQSIWWRGELVVAQTRKRLYWEFGNRSPSGVTGLTGAGVTISDPLVDETAQRAIFAVDKKPTGIFSVDMTYDTKRIPNPTEINIARFFTTHQFFTEAGLNMPHIFLRIGMEGKVPEVGARVNPLPPNLVWIRGLDFLPKLSTLDEVETPESSLRERIERLTASNRK